MTIPLERRCGLPTSMSSRCPSTAMARAKHSDDVRAGHVRCGQTLPAEQPTGPGRSLATSKGRRHGTHGTRRAGCVLAGGLWGRRDAAAASGGDPGTPARPVRGGGRVGRRPHRRGSPDHQRPRGRQRRHRRGDVRRRERGEARDRRAGPAGRPGRRAHRAGDRRAAGVPRRRRPEDRQPGGRRRQPAGDGRQREGRHRERARAVAADPHPQRHPHRRGRHPDRRSAQPRQLRWGARRLAGPGDRHQHRGRRRRPRPRRTDQRDVSPDHLRAHARRAGTPRLPRARDRAGATPARVGGPVRPADGAAGGRGGRGEPGGLQRPAGSRRDPGGRRARPWATRSPCSG